MGGWALVPKLVPNHTEGNLDLAPGWRQPSRAIAGSALEPGRCGSAH